MTIALVFVFGGLGALARLLTQTAWPQLGVPWSLVFINALGSLGIGILMARGAALWGLDPLWITVIAAGFFGGFTTFSGFSMEVVRLIESHQFLGALTYLCLQNLLAVGACYSGYILSK